MQFSTDWNHPQNKKASITLGKKVRSSTSCSCREDTYHALTNFLIVILHRLLTLLKVAMMDGEEGGADMSEGHIAPVLYCGPQ